MGAAKLVPDLVTYSSSAFSLAISILVPHMTKSGLVSPWTVGPRDELSQIIRSPAASTAPTAITSGSQAGKVIVVIFGPKLPAAAMTSRPYVWLAWRQAALTGLLGSPSSSPPSERLMTL